METLLGEDFLEAEDHSKAEVVAHSGEVDQVQVGNH